MKKLSTEEFINKSVVKHGNKYDYSLVEYINSHAKINIICKEHGIFKQLPYQHLNGHGCQNCAGCKRKTTKNFIKISSKIHNHKYDYSLVDYKNKNQKVKIMCDTHGIFEQLPKNHMKGHGCPKCAGRNFTMEDIIERFIKVHGDKYEYYKESFVGKSFKIKMKCKLHNYVFYQFIDNHLKGWGCSKCSGRYNYNNEEFINICKDVHNNKYDYSLTKYINSSLKIKIICPNHGLFSQTPSYHISGHGCPICKTSKGELEILKFLEKHEIEFNHQKRFENCKNKYALPFDFYLPKYNTCIEFQGMQHFKEIKKWGGQNSFMKIKKHDDMKLDFCKNNNINLLVINYNDNILEILKNNFDIK
jgi:hypothetical protein